MWQSKREISRECNDIIGSAKGSQISENYWGVVGKGKRVDVYLEVRKRRGHIIFEWNKCLCAHFIKWNIKIYENFQFVLICYLPVMTTSTINLLSIILLLQELFNIYQISLHSLPQISNFTPSGINVQQISIFSCLQLTS